jgi:hypothetical protein
MYGPTCGFAASSEVGLGATIGTLNMGYPLLLYQGEPSGATVKEFMGSRSSTRLRPTIYSHDQVRLTSMPRSSSPSSSIKGGINKLSYRSGSLQIRPRVQIRAIIARTPTGTARSHGQERLGKQCHHLFQGYPSLRRGSSANMWLDAPSVSHQTMFDEGLSHRALTKDWSGCNSPPGRRIIPSDSTI